MINVDVLVPGITPPAAVRSGTYPLPRPAALERLLCYADRRHAPAGSFEEAVFGQLGFAAEVAAGLPVAAATHWADFDGDHDGIWMRADPVVLRPDLGQLLLQQDQVETLNPEEAAAMVKELNAGLGGNGPELLAGRDGRRWYLRLPDMPAVVTQSPLAALGRHVDPYLPTGEEAGYWRRLSNDLQMLLHASHVNSARQAQGLAAVNSVWFWGVGRLSPAAGWRDLIVYSDEPLARGLALAAGVVAAAADGADVLRPQPGNAQVVLTDGWRANRLDQPQGWETALNRLESRWLEPLLRMLRRREIDCLRLRTLDYLFELKPASCRRFWRRPRPLDASL